MQRMHLLVIPITVLLGAVTVAVTGCEEEYSRQRMTMRTERLQRTVQVWSDSERARPARLERDLAWIPFDTQRRVERTQRDAQWFVDWQKRDIERFHDRGPIYLDKAGKILWGKPEKIEHNAITLFY